MSSAADFQRVATDHGWDLTREEYQFLIRKFDRNNTGSLGYDDFLNFMSLDARAMNDVESRFRVFLQQSECMFYLLLIQWCCSIVHVD
jgi:hypothetical protein